MIFRGCGIINKVSLDFLLNICKWLLKNNFCVSRGFFWSIKRKLINLLTDVSVTFQLLLSKRKWHRNERNCQRTWKNFIVRNIRINDPQKFIALLKLWFIGKRPSLIWYKVQHKAFRYSYKWINVMNIIFLLILKTENIIMFYIQLKRYYVKFQCIFVRNVIKNMFTNCINLPTNF